jgi:hypothetical protein
MFGSDAMHSDIAPTFHAYRYAKGVLVARCPSSDGYKTRAARLAEYVGGRWVHRAGGYLVSASKMRKLVDLYDAGKDACSFSRTLRD